jgi:hypothetical protein
MYIGERTRARLACGLVAVGLLVAAALAVLVARPTTVNAQTTQPCDFLTGGGWIVYHGARANFGVGGGCKDGSPTWGHLEYIDHGAGLKVHWTSITAYQFVDDGTGVDPKTGQPTGTRNICGTASTNLFGDVNFGVRAKDAGEPGVNDQFDIRLTNPITNLPVYDTATECSNHYLGSSTPCSPGSGGGGNIQLHKPNPSTTGNFGGACPALGGIVF